MKKAGVLLIILLLPFGGFCQTRADSIRAILLDPHDRTVLVASHRGVWTDVPENSSASIQAAIAAGAHIVEIDVRKTLSGKLILHHGPVLFGPSDATTLEEALLTAKGRIMVNVDKAFGLFDEIVEIAERTGTLDHIIFKGNVQAAKALDVLGDYFGKVIFMPVVNLCNEGALARIEDYMQRLNPPVFECVFRDDTDPVVTIARARLAGHCRIWVNTMWGSLCGGHDDNVSRDDPEAGYGWLIRELGTSVMQTDATAYLVNYLNKN